MYTELPAHCNKAKQHRTRRRSCWPCLNYAHGNVTHENRQERAKSLVPQSSFLLGTIDPPRQHRTLLQICCVSFFYFLSFDLARWWIEYSPLYLPRGLPTLESSKISSFTRGGDTIRQLDAGTRFCWVHRIFVLRPVLCVWAFTNWGLQGRHFNASCSPITSVVPSSDGSPYQNCNSGLPSSPSFSWVSRLGVRGLMPV